MTIDDSNTERNVEASAHSPISEAVAALEPFAEIAEYQCFSNHDDSYAPRPSKGRPNMGDFRRASAALEALKAASITPVGESVMRTALQKIAELRYVEDSNEPFDEALDLADLALSLTAAPGAGGEDRLALRNEVLGLRAALKDAEGVLMTRNQQVEILRDLLALRDETQSH